MTMPRTEHLAERPSWHCRACQQPWPCTTAKVNLATEYLHQPTALKLYLKTIRTIYAIVAH